MHWPFLFSTEMHILLCVDICTDMGQVKKQLFTLKYMCKTIDLIIIEAVKNCMYLIIEFFL